MAGSVKSGSWCLECSGRKKKTIADMTRRLFSEAMRIGADKEEILRIVNETAQEMRENNE